MLDIISISSKVSSMEGIIIFLRGLENVFRQSLLKFEHWLIRW